MVATFAYITITINPVLARIDPLTVRWYSVMYAAALALVLRRATRHGDAWRGILRDTIDALLWGVTVAGLVGDERGASAEAP